MKKWTKIVLSFLIYNAVKFSTIEYLADKGISSAEASHLTTSRWINYVPWKRTEARNVNRSSIDFHLEHGDFDKAYALATKTRDKKLIDYLQSRLN